MIEPDESSWHPAKDVAQALKDCTMCTWESSYNLVIGNTFERKASARLSSWLKKVRIVVNVRIGCCLMFWMNWVSIETQTSLRQYQNKPERLKAALRVAHCTPKYVIEKLDSSVQLTPELFTQIWKEKVSGLEGIGSSRQAEALDCIQIAAISAQIAKLTVALAESERRRVAEQENMSETVQQIKEQVMNLARRPTTSAPNDTHDESDEDDYVDPTP
ncbi:hypothetical protein H5410_033807 [Solanum commersonii]|uniref:Uncharacterized protein n=1 Tax=Solanum commersonii TaxID=4109 RepID=A0A9J5YRA7_SOLCO|nr:hypothetical protein H5410_033807 [Solanum commersonii]